MYVATYTDVLLEGMTDHLIRIYDCFNKNCKKHQKLLATRLAYKNIAVALK